jgi:hypothetical protein
VTRFLAATLALSILSTPVFLIFALDISRGTSVGLIVVCGVALPIALSVTSDVKVFDLLKASGL